MSNNETPGRAALSQTLADDVGGASEIKVPSKNATPTYVQVHARMGSRIIKGPPMLDNRSVLECCTVETMRAGGLVCYGFIWPDGVKYVHVGGYPTDGEIQTSYRMAWQLMQFTRLQTEFLSDILAGIGDTA